MDGIFEQIVCRERSTKSIFICAFVLFLTFAIPLTFILLANVINGYFLMLALFSFLLMIYASWYVITSLNVEYEYSVLDDEITVSSIIAHRKRKMLIKFSAKNIEEMGFVSESDAPIQAYGKTVFAGNDKDPSLCWAVVYSQKSGRSLVVFSPDNDFLSAVRPYIKRAAADGIFNNRGES